MAVVVFDLAAFRAAFPQFDAMADAQLQNFFNQACLILDNSDASPVGDVTERAMLLNWLVCHFATLTQRGAGIVGSLSSVSEGDVSAGYLPLPFARSAAWFGQTQCGAAYWQATLKYRQGGKWYAYCKH